MPRSFCNWNDHRRPEACLFRTAGYNDGGTESSATPPNQGGNREGREGLAWITNAFMGLQSWQHAPQGAAGAGGDEEDASAQSSPLDLEDLEDLVAGLTDEPVVGANLLEPQGQPAAETAPGVSHDLRVASTGGEGQPMDTSDAPQRFGRNDSTGSFSRDTDDASSVVSASSSASATPVSGGAVSRRPADAESPVFLWQECPCLLGFDCFGRPLLSPGTPGAGPPVAGLRATVTLVPDLLYWHEKHRWMWHKKWCLPRIEVRVTCNGAPLMAENTWVIVTAGTLREGHVGLSDQGLSGVCQRQLEGGQAIFPSLLFQRTSFNCGNRPFHLVITVIATRTPLITLCSSPVHVDARKRTKGERPDAHADDVRLIQRQRGRSASTVSSSNEKEAKPGQQVAWPADMRQQHQQQANMRSAHHQQSPHAPVQAQLAAPHKPVHNVAPVAATVSTPAHLTIEAFTQIVNATGDALIELRADCTIGAVLSRFAFGYTAAQLTNRSLLDITHVDDRPFFLQTVHALFAMSTNNAEAGLTQMPPPPASSNMQHAVRVIHRVMPCPSTGSGASTSVDSILTVIMGTHVSSSGLLLSSRYMAPPASPSNATPFRVLPARAPLCQEAAAGAPSSS